MNTKKCRITKTPERNEDLWLAYGKVITKYGDIARLLPKSYLYEEVASQFHMTGGTARNIIQKLMRERGEPSVINDRD